VGLGAGVVAVPLVALMYSASVGGGPAAWLVDAATIQLGPRCSVGPVAPHAPHWWRAYSSAAFSCSTTGSSHSMAIASGAEVSSAAATTGSVGRRSTEATV
jgi:hypothetical protein